jgi:hypothetical protein
MAVTMKKIALWRKEVDNHKGMLASTLESLEKTGADLQVLMGYRFPGNEAKAMIELYPVAGKRSIAPAKQAGLAPSTIPALLIEGDNKPGLAYNIAQGLAEAGINMSFLVAHVVGKRYAATLGLETEGDAKKATALIRKAGIGQKR